MCLRINLTSSAVRARLGSLGRKRTDRTVRLSYFCIFGTALSVVRSGKKAGSPNRGYVNIAIKVCLKYNFVAVPILSIHLMQSVGHTRYYPLN